MDPGLLIFLLFVASLVGGGIPLLFRESHRLLHFSLSLAAGFFLGVVFLHLLPELTQKQMPGVRLWGWVLAGLLILLILDLGMFGHRSHHIMGWATLLGLSVHAAAAGLGLGVHLESSYALVLSWAILSHKLGESFSLVSALRFSLSKRRVLLTILIAFSAITPLTMWLGHSLRSDLGSQIGSILLALAAGTFLYVAVGELLPEVFHEREDRLLNVAALLLGVFFAAASMAGETTGASGAPLVPATEVGWLGRWFFALVDFFVASAPYLLLGFFIAALIKAYLPGRWLARLLGRDDLGSVLTASAVGAPLPLCSCSVLPTAIGLHRRGASKGATVSFLVSTPETGVDSIGITYALLGPTMTIARPLAALASATAAGLATNLVVRGERVDPEGSTVAGAEVSGAGSAAVQEEAGQVGEGTTPVAGTGECAEGAEEGGGEDLLSEPKAPWPKRLKSALRYAFVDLVDDILPSLLVGFALSAILVAFLPPDFLAAPWARGWLGHLLALVVGVPIYICASASTPIAAAFIATGLSPGAALVFLLVGPATNLGSIFVLVKTLGRKVVTVYLLAVVIMALVFGALVDLLFASPAGLPEVERGSKLTDIGPVLHHASALLLLLLTLASVFRLPAVQRVVARVVTAESRGGAA